MVIHSRTKKSFYVLKTNPDEKVILSSPINYYITPDISYSPPLSLIKTLCGKVRIPKIPPSFLEELSLLTQEATSFFNTHIEHLIVPALYTCLNKPITPSINFTPYGLSPHITQLAFFYHLYYPTNFDLEDLFLFHAKIDFTLNIFPSINQTLLNIPGFNIKYIYSLIINANLQTKYPVLYSYFKAYYALILAFTGDFIRRISFLTNFPVSSYLSVELAKFIAQINERIKKLTFLSPYNKAIATELSLNTLFNFIVFSTVKEQFYYKTVIKNDFLQIPSNFYEKAFQHIFNSIRITNLFLSQSNLPLNLATSLNPQIYNPTIYLHKDICIELDKSNHQLLIKPGKTLVNLLHLTQILPSSNNNPTTPIPIYLY